METGYKIGLFLHLFSLFVAVGAATTMIVASSKLRAAKTGAECFPWGMLAAKTARFFPVASVGLFVTGAYLASKIDVWDEGWIWAAIVGLVILNVEGAVFGGRHGRELGAALKENGPGPLSPHIRDLTNERLHWAITLAAPGLVLGIVWNMIAMPDLGEAIAAMVIGWLAGAGLGAFIASRAPASADAPAAAAPDAAAS